MQQSQYRVAYPAVPLVGGVQAGITTPEELPAPLEPLELDTSPELPAPLEPPELDPLPVPLPPLEPPELDAPPELPPLGPPELDPLPELPALPELDAPPELPAPLEPPELDPSPELPAPLEPPELDEAPVYVPADPPVLELLLPPYGLEPPDAPLSGAGFDDPLSHATAMIDPAARAAIEGMLRFMIKPLLREILEGTPSASVRLPTLARQATACPHILPRKRARARARARNRPRAALVGTRWANRRVGPVRTPSNR